MKRDGRKLTVGDHVIAILFFLAYFVWVTAVLWFPVAVIWFAWWLWH